MSAEVDEGRNSFTAVIIMLAGPVPWGPASLRRKPGPRLRRPCNADDPTRLNHDGNTGRLSDWIGGAPPRMDKYLKK